MRAVLVCVIVLLSGCYSVANISDLQTSSSDIDFEYMAHKKEVNEDPFYSWRSSFESLVVIRDVTAVELAQLLSAALSANGYEIVSNSVDVGVLLAERGFTMDEYSSVAGVYYKSEEGKFVVYGKVNITQDITGDLGGNRAKEIMVSLCNIKQTCERL